MKALVVYDSVYGNTERIAQAIAGGIGAKEEARSARASDVRPADLVGLDLLIVGSPTQGGRATKAVQEFLKAIPAGGLKNVKTAAFDTRITKGKTGTFAKIFGYAAGRIENQLKRRGGSHAASEGFSVRGSEGPLEDGEMERAAGWAKKVASPPGVP